MTDDTNEAASGSRVMHHVRNAAAVTTFPVAGLLGWVMNQIADNRGDIAQNAKDIAVLISVMDERSRMQIERLSVRDEYLRRELEQIKESVRALGK